MPRKRKSNKHLPERVYLINGIYYYVEKKNGKHHNLGKSLQQAMLAWSKFFEFDGKMQTMQKLFERYMAEVASKKKPKSYKNNQKEVKKLMHAFGHLTPQEITPVDIYQYLDYRGQKAPVSANREKSLLSHVFTMAIRWGIVTSNPCSGVKSLPESSRDKVISDQDFQAVYKIASFSIQNIMEFAYITAVRQGDILPIRLSDITEKGIHVTINKNDRANQPKLKTHKVLILWTDKLKQLVVRATAHANYIGSSYLFANKKGLVYTSDGFQTNWQRLIKKALGHNYHLLLLNSTVKPALIIEKLEKYVTRKKDTAILIKYKKQYYVWGRKKDSNWSLTIIEGIDKLKKPIPEILNEDVPQPIPPKDVTEEIYKLLSKHSAHFGITKVIDDPFTFHDIRRKTATEVEQKFGLEAARKLLSHTNQNTTSIYISGVQEVTPLS